MRRVWRRGFKKGKSGGSALLIVQVKDARYSATCKAETQSRRKRGSGNVIRLTRVLGITRISRSRGQVWGQVRVPQAARPTDVLDVRGQVWVCLDDGKGGRYLFQEH
jgi:hypothetical protein